jgi:hypothetical protein
MVIATPWRMHELHAEIQILIKGGYLKEKKTMERGTDRCRVNQVIATAVVLRL